MTSISRTVGRGAANKHDDVAMVQALLNEAVYGYKLLKDGKIGPGTIGAIDYFQQHFVKIKPTGIVAPDSATFMLMVNRATAPVCEQESVGLPTPGSADPLKPEDYAQAAKDLGCELAAVKAVTEVEARGAGFFPSKRPKILFEAHIFSARTFHVFDKTYPDISSKNWNKALYKGGEAEYDRLIKAMAVDRTAALESASWGLFQIMGFNYASSGFGNVEQMVTAMFESEGKQLAAFVSFLKKNGLDKSLKDKNWKVFARGYNGPKYAENKYDTQLAAAYAKYSKQATAP